MGKKKTRALSGQFNKHTRGFGFVRTEDFEVYIAKENTLGAMNKDMVSIDLFPEYLWQDRPEGIVTSILSRASKEVVGTLQGHRGFAFVIPDERDVKEDIFVKKENMGLAKAGDKVLVKITNYPSRKTKAEGVVTEVIARAKDDQGEEKALIRAKGLKEKFPKEVLREARNLKEMDLEGRVDYRKDNVFTIDGADSKDFDDAVSIKKNEEGNYLLYVHIADVTYYVEDGSALDTEAFKRGTSVYLPDKVIPMLPEELSNGICSLNPGVDRLTITCLMEIDSTGKILSHDIHNSVVNSKRRLVYNEISDVLEKKDPIGFEDVYDDLLLMEELTYILRKSRAGLDFELPESKITMEDGKVVSVDVVERRIANILIEEFMLAANRTIAEHFYWMNVPFVYRVHEKPDMEKMVELKAFLAMFGIPLKGKMDNIHPSTLAKILEDYDVSIIKTVILRSMQKAYYSTDCIGHFGLAYPYYCHFTSPIRRYPDLMIHRIIKKALLGEDLSSFEAKAQAAAEQSSKMEKVALELERDVEKIKKAQYILNFKNRKFEGVISGVTEYGIYVELENTIEGMVRMDSLKDDFYIYDPKRYRAIGERTRKVYALGQRVLIRVKGANPKARQIDFVEE
ncbi:MAG: ribonuclease R [Clostridia bacterium]|nr:ribonuclease R [Clostridia bacterium]